MTKEQSVNYSVKDGEFSKKLTTLCLKLEQSVNDLGGIDINDSWSDFQPSYCVADKNREDQFDVIVVHPRIKNNKECFVIQDQRRNSPTFNPIGIERDFTFDEVLYYIKGLVSS